MAANTTFVATTTEGNTVVRTSATRTYTHVCMATKEGQLEGAMSWHGDKANATKAAQTWASRGFATRVVPVEQALTGKAARLVLEAVKTAQLPVDVDASYADDTTAKAMVAAADADPAMTPVDAVDAIDQALATGTKAAAKKATKVVVQPRPDAVKATAKKAAKVAVAAAKPEMPVAPDTTELAELLEQIRVNELAHYEMVLTRNTMIAKLNAEGLSYAKIAQLTGVTPMATRAMAMRALELSSHAG